MSLRHLSFIVLFAVGACAAPTPSRVKVSYMGITAHGDTTTITSRSGDTVYKIAQHLGIDARVLIDRNNLVPPYTLSPGQVLRVPAPETLKVVPGDTLFSVARSYDVDQAEIVK